MPVLTPNRDSYAGWPLPIADACQLNSTLLQTLAGPAEEEAQA